MFVIIFAAALAAQEANPAPIPSEQWTEYKDETRGFLLCYPAGQLSAEQSTKKSDGLHFISNDGIQLKFWSREDNRDKLLFNASKDLNDEVEKEHGSFIFNSRGGSIFAPWDYAEMVFGGRTHYQLMRRSRMRVLYMRLSVPKSLGEAYRSVADRLANCFKPISPSG